MVSTRMSTASRKYRTPYQRAKAKAERHHWQPALTTGQVAVAKILKSTDTLTSDSHRKTITPYKDQNRQPGYRFRQISKRKSPDGFTLSFQFYSPKADSAFVVKAFYYEQIDTFMIKFFNRSAKSLNKYAIRTNLGDFPAILRTNFDILAHLTAQYQTASFGFMGERSFFKDRKSKTTLLEPMARNQRFRIYRLFLKQPGRYTWLTGQHYQLRLIEKLSTYLLLRHNSLNTREMKQKQRQLMDFFAKKFPEINFTNL